MREDQRVIRLFNAPVDIDLGGVNAENLFSDPHDNREGFVNFKESDVVNGEVGLLEGFWQSNGRCDGEVDRLNTSIGMS